MNILTFDIEEFTLYPRMGLGGVGPLYTLLDKVLALLDERGIKATFFCLGEIARINPEVIKTIYAKGHDIGCHSDKHHWLTDLTPEEFYEDTKLACDSIENVIGSKVISYRAPAFSIGEKNKWAIEILRQCGIEIDCSIFPQVRDFGGFSSFPEDKPTLISYNGATLKELPISMGKILGKKMAYSGGGYFRLLPYDTIKRITQSKDYVMTYFHLRDFDTDQNKKATLSPRYFKSYYGINGAFGKFAKYIHDFDFINVSEAAKLINWNSVSKINI